MTALLVYYFIYVVGALSLGLIVYKVFDKILDFISDLTDLICHNYD